MIGVIAPGVALGYAQRDMAPSNIPIAEALLLDSLVTPIVHGTTSRVLGRGDGGSLTLFAFDAGESLSEHTSSFEAFAMVLDGALSITINGASVRATPGTIVRLPAAVPHAVDAAEPARMLLVLLKGAG